MLFKIQKNNTWIKTTKFKTSQSTNDKYESDIIKNSFITGYITQALFFFSYSLGNIQ